MKFYAREVRQGETVFYETAIAAGNITDERFYQPDRWDTLSNEGYQREVNEGHARRIMQHLKNTDSTNVLPTNLVINFRKPLAIARTQYEGVVEIEVPDSSFPGYVIDGQHRIAAIRKAIDDGVELDNYQMGVTITRFSLKDEMVHFRNINVTANRPPKGLSQVIGARLTEEFDTPALTAKDQATNRTVAILSRLTSDPGSPWYGKVAMGGVRKRSFHTTVQSQVISSMVGMFMNGRFADPTERTDHVYNLFLNWWKAVAEVFPEAVNNTDSSIIMRVGGFYPLHIILGRVLSSLNPNPTYGDMVQILTDIRTNLNLDETAWDRDRGGLAQRIYGYSINRGHTVLADLLWSGVDQRTKIATSK